ncbi:MAG: GNAT family N-acetyltransferase [Actinomycetota bacterium]
MSTRSAVLEWGRERLRVGRWRSDSRTAILSPAGESALLSRSFIERCLKTLADEGYTSAVTAALSRTEQAPFLAAGFYEHERLRLLSHDLRRAPVVRDAPLRRALDHDHPAVLAVDAASFSPFWQLDEWSLREAIEATPSTLFKVAVDGADQVVGYAIAGRTQRRGYLQRLAVHPDCQRLGLGAALVADSLRWMRRRGVERVVVNTQMGNEAARRLYVRLGFREERDSLAVLRYDLP